MKRRANVRAGASARSLWEPAHVRVMGARWVGCWPWQDWEMEAVAVWTKPLEALRSVEVLRYKHHTATARLQVTTVSGSWRSYVPTLSILRLPDK